MGRSFTSTLLLSRAGGGGKSTVDKQTPQPPNQKIKYEPHRTMMMSEITPGKSTTTTSSHHTHSLVDDTSNGLSSIMKDNNRNNIKSIEELVAEIWLELPGIGAKALQKLIQQRQPQQQEDVVVSGGKEEEEEEQPYQQERNEKQRQRELLLARKRIQAAKDAIRYRRIFSTPSPTTSPSEAATTTTVTTTSPTTTEKEDVKEVEKEEEILFDKDIFVQQQLELRQSYRTAKNRQHLQKADDIYSGLTAMGIEIDDKFKTWKFVPGKKKKKVEGSTTSNTDTDTKATNTGGSGIPCQRCHRLFGSRNLIFQHLRDPASGCGTDIWASGETVPVPPSFEKKVAKQEARKLYTKGTNRTIQQADDDCCLWVGGLPLPWTKASGRYRRLRAILYTILSPLQEVPPPWIKVVNRKAYRDRGGEQGEGGKYVGYAIVVFRDAKEATMVRDTINGISVCYETIYGSSSSRSRNGSSGRRREKGKHDVSDLINLPEFSLKVRDFEPGDSPNNNDKGPQPPVSTNDDDDDDDDDDKGEVEDELQQNGVVVAVVAGQDPPLSQQLKPLSREELWRRAGGRHPNAEEEKGPVDELSPSPLSIVPSTSSSLRYQDHGEALRHAIARYNEQGDPRRIIYHQGRLVPKAIRDELLQVLEQLRWPAKIQRNGMDTERYLVLQSNVSKDPFYQNLRDSCRTLMNWANPQHYYSAIAITKNFVGSPHIDDRDQTYQYAMCLGNFDSDTGGQLCVDGGEHDCLHVVDTYNRMAKVDGRHVHWVRTWQGGDRYSLIFYDTSDRNPTPIVDDGVLNWDDNVEKEEEDDDDDDEGGK